MVKKILIVILLLADLAGLPLLLHGQDPNYSQWLNAPLYYNPAYAGLGSGIRARLSGRDQWPNLQQPYKTYYFSVDYGDRNLPGAGGIGLLVNRENEGTSFIKDLSVGLAITARVRLSYNAILQIGIKGALMEKWLVWDNLIFSDQLNPKYGNIYNTSVLPPDNQQKMFPDFGFGGITQFANRDGNIVGTAGIAVDHILQPDEAFLSMSKSPLPRKYVGHLDFVITTGAGPSSSQNPLRGFGDALRLNPGIIYQNQHGLSSLQLGVNALKYNFYLGGYIKASALYGESLSMTLLAGYRYMISGNLGLKFMYSYDAQLSGNLRGTGGAHEISLILEFKGIGISGGNRYEVCPAIEQPEHKPGEMECSPF